MPKVELTYQQILDAVKQLTAQEQQQLGVDLHPHPGSLAKGTGEPIARHHDAYLYRKDD
jgi:hypothetical protein